MTVRTCLIAALAFGLGFVAHFAISRIPVDKQAQDIAYHWQRVNDFNEHIRDPRNLEEIDGMGAVTPLYDPEPSLAALVAAGELEHVDLVLPTVPQNRETTSLWMHYCDDRRDKIIYATANPESIALAPSGDPPFHMNIWFMKTATADVQRLIRELEELAASETENSKVPASANP